MSKSVKTFIEPNNKKNLLKEEGNIKIEALYGIIQTRSGKPDLLAIDIYTEARSWFKPKKTNIQGNIIYSSKLNGYGWQIGYEDLANKYKRSKDLIRTKLVLLEKLGLLTRDFRTEYYHGKRFNNNMYLLVWKDTPHFYSEIGLKKKVAATTQNQGELCINSSTPILENKDNIYVIPNNGKEKEEALAYSSFSSSIPSKGSTPIARACARETEIVKISPTSFEETPQEESTEIPTLATGYPTEPAKVYQTEEIRVVETEAVTNCDRLGEISLLQDIPLLANLLSPTVDNSSTVVPETIEPDKNVQFPKYQEVKPMKQQQIPNEPERNMEFELSGAIFKSFGGVKSDEIMENCKFIPINQNKLGVQLSNGFSLTPTDKDRLKACIRLVYGEGINIVSSAVLKIAQPKLEILVKPQIQQYYHQWTRFKNDLLNYLPEKTGHHILNAWFDKFRAWEDPINNRIILTGSRFYVDNVYNRFQSAIEYVVKKNKITLELHFENNDEKPIIYKPNGGF